MSEEGSLSPLREELVLKHGLLLHKTYKVSSKINSLIYNSEKESVVVLLRGGMSYRINAYICKIINVVSKLIPVAFIRQDNAGKRFQLLTSNNSI